MTNLTFARPLPTAKMRATSMSPLTMLQARAHRTLGWLLLPIALGVLSGCYDGDALVKQAQSVSLDTRLAEIDLGRFQTTLRRDANSHTFTELDLHIFGTVSRSRLSAVKKQLKADEYRLRHETLAAVRKSTREELAEPTLAQLRARIEQVVNGILADSPVNEIGFYQLTLRQP
jgi:hypothetical protein